MDNFYRQLNHWLYPSYYAVLDDKRPDSTGIMPMKIASNLLATVMAVSALAATGAGLAQPIGHRSATLSTEINEFRLGMTLDEASKLARLTAIPGGDQVEAQKAGFSYNFGVTPRGRIYRIKSTQQLGRFATDASFLATLQSKLTSKYGKPTSVSGDSFEWSLIEPVTHLTGQRLPFKTMWMAAYLGYDDAGQTLEMTILDFRILWTDQAAVNRTPRQQAEQRIRF